MTPEYNAEPGLYRIRLCKNGRWQEITIDDLIPCYAKGEPVFSQTVDKDLWVPLLEKAFAKVHGGYHQLRGGSVAEALMDLSGCPTMSYRLEDENVRNFVQSGQFWSLLEHFKAEDYLVAFESEPITRWTTCHEALEQERKYK